LFFREGSHERRKNVKRLGIWLLALGWVLVLVNPVMAQQLVEGVVTGCKAELEKYCSNVTPGEARILACLYAHNDKLSGRCEYALYDAAVQLERAVAALTYVANECAPDLRKHCARVEAGEGRLLECLQKNDAEVSNRCKQARKDVGLK
jgi:hypothetical protein